MAFTVDQPLPGGGYILDDDHLDPLTSHNWEPDAFVRSSRRKDINDLGNSLVNRTDRLAAGIDNAEFDIEKLQNRVAFGEAIFWLWLAWVIIEVMR